MGLLNYSQLLAVEKIKNRDDAFRPYASKVRSVALSTKSGGYREVKASLKSTNRPSEMSMKSTIGEVKNRHRFRSTCGRYIYHIAIIDYLTEFNFFKRAESFWKVTCRNRKEWLVSAVHPGIYGDRFKWFMKKEVIINEDIQKERNVELKSQDVRDALFNVMKKEMEMCEAELTF